MSASRKGGMICQILRVRLLGDPSNKWLTTFVAVPTSQSRMILGIQVGVSCACELACVTDRECIAEPFQDLIGKFRTAHHMGALRAFT